MPEPSSARCASQSDATSFLRSKLDREKFFPSLVVTFRTPACLLVRPRKARSRPIALLRGRSPPRPACKPIRFAKAMRSVSAVPSIAATKIDRANRGDPSNQHEMRSARIASTTPDCLSTGSSTPPRAGNCCSPRRCKARSRRSVAGRSRNAPRLRQTAWRGMRDRRPRKTVFIVIRSAPASKYSPANYR